jgi:type II secretory pathway pseudopilin PulG
MNLAPSSPSLSSLRPAQTAAFSLAELMCSLAIFSFMVAGLLYVWVFGMRQDELVNSKIGSTEQARTSFNDLSKDIRAAKIWAVGTFPETSSNPSDFTPLPDGVAHQGNALKICLDANQLNKYWLYYFRTTRGELWRMHSTDNSQKRLAQFLTNTMYFRAEDFRGVVQTTSNYKEIINVCMQFYQYQFPLTKIGSNYLYNYYKLEFRISSHAPD